MPQCHPHMILPAMILSLAWGRAALGPSRPLREAFWWFCTWENSCCGCIRNLAQIEIALLKPIARQRTPTPPSCLELHQIELDCTRLH